MRALTTAILVPIMAFSTFLRAPGAVAGVFGTEGKHVATSQALVDVCSRQIDTNNGEDLCIPKPKSLSCPGADPSPPECCQPPGAKAQPCAAAYLAEIDGWWQTTLAIIYGVAGGLCVAAAIMDNYPPLKGLAAFMCYFGHFGAMAAGITAAIDQGIQGNNVAQAMMQTLMGAAMTMPMLFGGMGGGGGGGGGGEGGGGGGGGGGEGGSGGGESSGNEGNASKYLMLAATNFLQMGMSIFGAVQAGNVVKTSLEQAAQIPDVVEAEVEGASDAATDLTVGVVGAVVQTRGAVRRRGAAEERAASLTPEQRTGSSCGRGGGAIVQCAVAGGAINPDLQRPEFEQAVQKGFGQSLDSLAANSSNGTAAGMGALLGGLGGAGGADAVTAEIKGLTEQIASFGGGSMDGGGAYAGGGGGRAKGPGGPDMAGMMAGMMEGLMGQLNPEKKEEEKKRDDNLLVFGAQVDRRPAEEVAQDKTVSIFDRISWRYRKADVARAPWASPFNRMSHGMVTR